MQRDDLAIPRIVDPRSRIAAEGRAIVAEGGNVLAETVDGRARQDQAWLKTLDVVQSAKNLVLHRWVIAVVKGRVAYHDDLGVDDFFWRAHRKLELDMVGSQPLDLQQSHVPIGMDHDDLAHGKHRGRHAVALPHEVDPRRQATLECQLAVAKPGGENLGDVPVGHQKVLADNKSGASVGKARMVRKLDAADRGNCLFDAAMQGGIRRELDPQGMVDDEVPIDDIHRRTLVGNDDCFGDETLFAIELVFSVNFFNRALHQRRVPVRRDLRSAMMPPRPMQPRPLPAPLLQDVTIPFLLQPAHRPGT